VPALLLELSTGRYDLFNLTLRGGRRRDECGDPVFDGRKRCGPVLQVLNPRFERLSAGRCGCRRRDYGFQDLIGLGECGTPASKLVEERCKRISLPLGRFDESFEVFGALARLATDQALDRVKHQFLGARHLGPGGALASKE
jgi:hypothetical protein